MTDNEIKNEYYITKDNNDGTREIVAKFIATEQEAWKRFDDVIKVQLNEYRVLKTLPRWRIIRLFDCNNKQIAQES